MEIISIDCEKPRMIHGPIWPVFAGILDSAVFPIAVTNNCIASTATPANCKHTQELLRHGIPQTKTMSCWCIPERFGGGTIKSEAGTWTIEGSVHIKDPQAGTIRDAVETSTFFYFCDDLNIWRIDNECSLEHLFKLSQCIFSLAALIDNLLVCVEGGVLIVDRADKREMSLIFAEDDVDVHGAVMVADQVALIIVSREDSRQTWLAFARIEGIYLKVEAYAANELFLVNRGRGCRGFLTYIPELSLLLAGHSQCDQVAVLRRDGHIWNVLLMPEGKQLGCAISGDGSTTLVRGIYHFDCRELSGEYSYCIALGQSDGKLSVHWLELPDYIANGSIKSLDDIKVGPTIARDALTGSTVVSSFYQAGLPSKLLSASGVRDGPSSSAPFGALRGSSSKGSSSSAGLFGEVSGPSPFGLFGSLGVAASSSASVTLTELGVPGTTASPFGAFGGSSLTDSSCSAGLFGQAPVKTKGTSPVGALGGVG